MTNLDDTTTVARKWANSKENPAGPRQVKAVNHALSQLGFEHRTKVEKWGVIGLSEHDIASVNLFGTETREDVTAVQLEIGQRFDWTVTRDNANAIIQAITDAMPALIANRPVSDQRKTRETADAETQKRLAMEQKMEDDRAAERRVFLETFGEGIDQTVPVTAGSMAIVAQLTFDNSDMMTDYFDRHATMGPAFLLAVVSQGAKTEARARAAVAKFPQLASLPFQWRTENYSGGHGNYLDQHGGPYVDIPEACQTRMRYRGDAVKSARWEIKFTKPYGAERFELPPLKGYAEAQKQAEMTTSGETIQGTGVKMVENKEHNGIELHFDAKPTLDTLGTLKIHGWRWSMRNRCWYHRDTADARALAQRILGSAA